MQRHKEKNTRESMVKTSLCVPFGEQEHGG